MLIVSQDKTMSLNLDNIEAIGVGNPLEDNDGKFQILVNTTSDNQYPIAEYETEERAKEIMMQIVKWQSILKKNSVLAMADKGYTFPQKYYFEMPEE